MTDSKKRIPDFCDCGAEFLRRNLKRFIPAFGIYAILFGLYSYFITGVYNFDGLMELAEDPTLAIDVLLGTYAGGGAAALASFVRSVISGMLIYYTYTKLMTGKEPDRKFTFKRGLIYALYATLWGIVLGIALYILILIPALIIMTGTTYAWFTVSAEGSGSSASVPVLAMIAGILVIVLLVIWLIVYFYGRLSLAAPLTVIKNQNIFSAAKSSWKLTKKRCFRTLVLLASCTILTESAVAIVATLTSVSMFNYSIATAILTAIINGVAAIADFASPVILTFAIVDREKRNGDLDAETELNSFLSERGV